MVSALLLAACGGGGDLPDDRAAVEAERLRPLAAQPSQGRWAAPVRLDFVPAAAAQVAAGGAAGAGRVVMWSAENRFSFGAQGETAPTIRTWTATFDAATGTAGASTQDVTGHNMFCPGTANLADGRILVTGGSTSRVSSVYDPVARTWTRPAGTVMNIPRAYHATVPLRDGSVFMLGGSWNGGVGGKDGEVWRADTGWRRLSGVPAAPFETPTGQAAGRNDRDFHMWLLPAGNGQVFHAGPSSRMHWIDTRGNGGWRFAATRGGDPDALQGSIAMFEPGRILVTGGARVHDGGVTALSTATANAHLVDITGTPTVTRLPDMAYTRVFHNSVVLPNGQVMVIGGRDVSVPFNDGNARLVSELFDPATNRFLPLPAMSIPRTYHSWALLMPDARVLVAGGGLCGCAADQPTYQLYAPHYLFNADGTPAVRPQLTSAPTQADFGSEFTVATDTAVASFALVRLSSVTHTVNNDQRRIPLTVVSSSGTSYRLAAPSNPGWAMPGDYMLFAIDARGVPSLARTVRLGLGGVPLVEPVADQSAIAGTPVAPMTVSAPVVAGRSFVATGLPPGLSIDPVSGVVGGTPTAAGVFRVSVGVRGGTGGTSTEFLWTVQASGNVPVAARHLRLEQLSEVNGNPWGSIAELDLLSPQGQLLPRTGWRASASSSETVAAANGPANAIDGNRATIWHSQWGSASPPPPHRFDIDLGSAQLIGGFRYLPRVDGSLNGTIAQYRVYLSQDGVNWGQPVASGDLRTVTAAADRTQTVMFAAAPAPNRPPTLVGPPAQTTAAGSTVSLPVSASDPDGDRLTFTATGLPPGLAIDGATGRIAGVPTTRGGYTVSVSVSDGRGGSASAGFGWTVSAAPAPVVQPIESPPAVAGTAVTFTANATGANLAYAWDFGDGSPRTAFSVSPTATRTFAAPGLYTVTVTVRAADGTTTTRSVTQAVAAAPTTVRARASSTMAVETRTGAPARLWVVNHDHDTVSVFDLSTNARVAEVPVGAAPQSVAVAPNGAVWVTNRDASSVSVVAAGTLSVSATIALPRASQPYGLVIAPSGAAFVALAARGEVQRINADRSLGARVAVGTDVRELAVSGDGRTLLASRFVTPPLPGEGTTQVDTAATRGGEVAVLDAGTLARRTTVILRHSDKTDSTVQGRGIPNYLGAPVISPDGRSAWIPSKQDNVRRGGLRDGQALDFQNTVRAISSRIDLAAATPVEDHPARIDHDNASVASAAAFHPSGAYLFVTLETSRQVAVVDPAGRRELFRLPVGLAPQGVAVSPDGLRLYVSNFMSRSLTVLDLNRLVRFGEPLVPTLATVPTTGSERLAPAVLRGKQFFYDAADRRLSRDAYMSCAACHRDGAGDGRTWDLSSVDPNRAKETGHGEGLRNTPSLRGRAGMGHGALHWSGNFDEVQDFEEQIRRLAGGTGLIAGVGTDQLSPPLGARKAGLSQDLDDLAAYVGSLSVTAPTPHRNADGTLTAAGIAGRTLFQNLACASCHGGAQFTGSTLTARLHDIGTLKASSGQRLGGPLTGIDAPTLRDVWATAPYLHDGSAPTVEDAIRAHRGPGVPTAAAIAALTATEVANLAAYVRQIGREEATAPAPTTATNLALGRPAVQSSTEWGAVASIAVDGVTDGDARTGAHVTHTGNAPNEWWQVDLVEPAAIQSVTLWNRSDCCVERLSDAWLLVSSVDMAGRSLAQLLADPAVWRLRIDRTVAGSRGFAVNATGRFVRVQQAGADYLSLAEVQVVGTPLVAGANRAPSVSPPTAQVTVQGTAVELAIVGVDPDGDPLAWSATGLPPGLTIDAVRGVIRGTVPATAPLGGTTVSVTARDNRSPALSTTVRFDWTVTGGTPAVNLALGRPATQSSTLWGMVAGVATDGIVNGTASAGPFVTHTALDLNAWWQVDLGSVRSIERVVLWGRTDCCSDRLSDFHVMVSATEMTGRSHAALLADPAVVKLRVVSTVGTTMALPLPAGTTGRFVRVQLAGTNYLELSEVQVMGR